MHRLYASKGMKRKFVSLRFPTGMEPVSVLFGGGLRHHTACKLLKPPHYTNEPHSIPRRGTYYSSLRFLATM